MGFWRNLAIGLGASTAIAAAANKAEAGPLDMRQPTPVVQKVKSPKKKIKIKKGPIRKRLDLTPRLEIKPIMKHPAFYYPKPSNEETWQYPMLHLRSIFGLSAKLDYIVPDAVQLKTDGKLWYQNLSFDIQNENFLDKLIYYAQSDLPFASTPIDRVAFDILGMDEIQSRDFAGLSLLGWYNVYRIFYGLVNSSFDGTTFKTDGEIKGQTDSHAELLSSHFFMRGKELIRYDHGIRYSIWASGLLAANGMFKFGEGANYGLHELEKYFGSEFALNFRYLIQAYMYASETHQFSQKIDHGWQGGGLEYREFYKAVLFQNLLVNAAATMEQLENLHLVDLFVRDSSSMDTEEGFSYLLYAFRRQSFRNFWYYAMAGTSMKDYDYYYKNKERVDDIFISLFGNFEKETDKRKLEREGHATDYNFNFALLGGLNVANVFHPYLGYTNYPFDKILGGFFLTLPRFVADLNVKHYEFRADNMVPNLEFFVPILYNKDYKEPLVQYFREKTVNFVSPFSAWHTLNENARREAYTRLDGLFIRGGLEDKTAWLSVLASRYKKSYFELGFDAHIEGNGWGLFTRIGYKNFGMFLNYGRRLNSEDDLSGYNVGLGMVGNFGKFFVKANLNCWFKRDLGFGHPTSAFTRANSYADSRTFILPKDTKYFFVNLGWRF